MANEAVLLAANNATAIDMSCPNEVGIEKGALLKLSGDNTVITSAGADIFIGIAAAEKVAADGSTRIGVYPRGCGADFDITCSSSAVTLGAVVALSGVNVIKDAIEADFPNGKAFGQTYEAGSAAEVIRVKI